MILQMKQPTSRSSVRWVRRCASSTCFRDSRWLGVRPRVCLRSQLVAFSIKLSPELFLRRKDKFVPAGEDLFVLIENGIAHNRQYRNSPPPNRTSHDNIKVLRVEHTVPESHSFPWLQCMEGADVGKWCVVPRLDRAGVFPSGHDGGVSGVRSATNKLRSIACPIAL